MKNHRRKIIFFGVAIFEAVVLILLVKTCREHFEDIATPDVKQPYNENLERDKKQIVQTYIDAVEYYRQQCILHGCDSVYDVTGMFCRYAIRDIGNDDSSECIPSPYPADTQIEVRVGEIFYDKSNLLCATIIAVNKTFTNPDSLSNYDSECHYKGICVIGRRHKVEEPFMLYPISAYSCWAYSFERVFELMKSFAYRFMKDYTGSFTVVFQGEYYGYNMQDPQFFEKSPLFQKFDEKRYNFQMRRFYNDRLGKIDYYEYPTEPFTYKRDSIRDQPDSISNNRPQVKG